MMSIYMSQLSSYSTKMLFPCADIQDRVGIKPVINHDIWVFYKRGLASMWFVEDVDLTEDIKQWPTVDPKIKHFLKYILAFFHGADKLVSQNCSTNFADEVPILEAQFWYRFQAMAEDVHSEMYGTLLDALIPDRMEKEHIFNSIESMPVIKAKADWALKYSNRDSAPFAERLVAFAVMEGLFFSGSFCAIYYVRDQGILPGLCFSNDYISRDEGEHCKFACMLYSKLNKEYILPQKRVHQIFREAVEIETEFVTQAIPVKMIGMSSELMTQYIKYVADFWLVELGYQKIYGVTNPFAFMNMISVERKTNFFEKRSGEYQKANVGNNTEDQQLVFNEEEDF